jgi:hypothetical protein
MLEGQRLAREGLRAPALPAHHVTVEPVPHHLPNEAADILETGPAIEFRGADRHLVAHPLPDAVAGAVDVIGLARTGAEPRISLHLLDQPLEISLRQVEIEVELAEIGVPRGVDRLPTGIEGVDHPRAHGPVAAILAPDHADPVVPGRVIGQDLGALVGRSVIDDHPQRRPMRLRDHAVEGAAHELGLVAAGGDDHVGAWIRGARIRGARFWRSRHGRVLGGVLRG